MNNLIKHCKGLFRKQYNFKKTNQKLFLKRRNNLLNKKLKKTMRELNKLLSRRKKVIHSITFKPQKSLKRLRPLLLESTLMQLRMKVTSPISMICFLKKISLLNTNFNQISFKKDQSCTLKRKKVFLLQLTLVQVRQLLQSMGSRQLLSTKEKLFIHLRSKHSQIRNTDN